MRQEQKNQKGQTKKTKRGKRTEWEKKSRESAKRLNLNLNPVIDWGYYDPNFPTSGAKAELELHGFLQRL
jgi:hypothetical protein